MVLSSGYEYDGGKFTRAELKARVEGEIADLDEGQWFGGDFQFNEWLSDSIVTGSVKRVDL